MVYKRRFIEKSISGESFFRKSFLFTRIQAGKSYPGSAVVPLGASSTNTTSKKPASTKKSSKQVKAKSRHRPLPSRGFTDSPSSSSDNLEDEWTPASNSNPPDVSSRSAMKVKMNKR